MNPLPRLRFASRLIFFRALCAILCTVPAYPQGPTHFGHQAWTTENGLPQNSVHQVFQSQDGYIWIATEGGVVRFNGIDFKIFNHESDTAFISDDISCLAQDAHGALWIGTSDGLLQYSAGKFHRYASGDGLPSSNITALATNSDGALYIFTNDGITSFNGTKFSHLDLSATAMSAANGSILFASPAGISQYLHGRMSPLSIGLTTPKESIQGLGPLPNDGIWLRTQTSITLLENGRQRTFLAGVELPTTRIESFLVDTHGNLWIGTNRGLFLLDKSNSRPQFQSSVGPNSILSISEDREGNLWVGTETAGLHILRQQDFRTLPSVSDHVISAITQTTDGAMWLGTNGDGLDRWESGRIQHFSTHNGLLSEIILALAADSHGGVWVGTPDGLIHISKNKVSTYSSADGLPDDFIRSLYSDDDGSLWIGTRRGLAHLQNRNVTIYTRANGLNSDLIGALIKSHSGSPQDLWIGTLDGLSRLHDGKILTYGTKDGLSGNVITSLFEDSHDTLWIGTQKDGLNYWNNGSFTSLHRSDLPKSIDSILEDEHGYLWLGSTRGIRRVARSELYACASSPNCAIHPKSYGYTDGMPTDEISTIGHPTSWKTIDHHLWFATRKGVAIAEPEHLSENLIPPPVAIERFAIDESDLTPSAAELNIPPGHGRFVFEYAGLSFVAPAKVRYRYILEGFDRQWTQAGSRRIAYYTNLPPHHYRFRVQAANNDGVWNETGAVISFNVHPPFYRRAWFLLLSILLIGAIAVLLYLLRVRRLRSQFDAVLAERNRMAREIHDTLAQSFVGVSVQLELASQLLAQSDIPAAHQQIDHTRAYVREGLVEARRSIWDLRAITAQRTLPTRLTQLVEKLNTQSLSKHLNIGGTYRTLIPAIEDEVLRIAQEALANVARHAHANTVSVDLRYHSIRLSLVISDDGRGFEICDDFLQAKGHFGLQGMRERAAQINAQLTIESSNGKGTTISLDVPISAPKGTRGNA